MGVKHKIFTDALLDDIRNWRWHTCPKCGEKFMGDSSADGLCAGCLWEEKRGHHV